VFTRHPLRTSIAKTVHKALVINKLAKNVHNTPVQIKKDSRHLPRVFTNYDALSELLDELLLDELDDPPCKSSIFLASFASSGILISSISFNLL